MTLKEFFKKFPVSIFQNNQKKVVLNLLKNYSFIVYTTILLITFVVYSTTFKSINNQKMKMPKI